MPMTTLSHPAIGTTSSSTTLMTTTMEYPKRCCYLSTSSAAASSRRGDVVPASPLIPLDTSIYYPSPNANESSDDADERDAKEEARRQAIRDEIDSRKGRLWSDPMEITDEDWASGKKLDDLPDWSKELCSRVSLERIRVHRDGIPTIETLATTPLPPPPPPHPANGNPSPYNKHRKDRIYSHIQTAVSDFASPQIDRILALGDDNWDAKQDAIDDLFEKVQTSVAKNAKGVVSGVHGDDFVGSVLASQPNFPILVERALEAFLRDAVKQEKTVAASTDDVGSTSTSEEGHDDDAKDEHAIPIFMDFHKIKDSDAKADFDGVVPKLLHPLKIHAKNGPGRMIEEWELAANSTTKRIMARHCMRDVARCLLTASTEDSTTAIDEEGCRIYVRGEKGTGKTATLAAIVASARLSGHIVLYLPDGDRLRKNGFYIVPNEKREGVYDLPMLAQEICGELLESHGRDMEGMVLEDGEDCLAELMTKSELRKFMKAIGGSSTKSKGKGNKGAEETSTDVTTPPPLSLNDLLEIGSEDPEFSSAIYTAVVQTLTNQSQTPFTVVMDEFNCYFDRGHYFHQEYDYNVVRSIPPNRISLFKPLLAVIGLEKDDDGTIRSVEPKPIRRGGIIVGTSESRSVGRSVMAALDDAIETGVVVDGTSGISHITVVDVPQYSPLEVEHVLANFEVTGIGRLRFDQGATVMDKQEVAYLRMVSGGVGQRLMDSCIA